MCVMNKNAKNAWRSCVSAVCVCVVRRTDTYAVCGAIYMETKIRNSEDWFLVITIVIANEMLAEKYYALNALNHKIFLSPFYCSASLNK